MHIAGNVPLTHVLDLLIDAVCVVDTEGRFLYVSAAFETIFGYTPQEILGRQMLELVHPDDRARTLNAVDEIVAGVHKPNFENRYLRKDGSDAHIMWTARWSPDNRMRVAVARDITERKCAELRQAALYAVSDAAYGADDLPTLFQRVHAIVGGLLPTSGFAVALYDPAQDRLSFPYHADPGNPVPPTASLRTSGTLSAEVIGRGEPLLVQRDATHDGALRQLPDVGLATQDWLGVPLATPGGVIGALIVQNRAGERRYTAADAEMLRYASTQVAAAVARKLNEAVLQHVARHDPLTGLPNRSLFRDRLDNALARARREQHGLALLYLDIDRFKQVNDAHGHVAGDQLLHEVAQRLHRCVREVDTVGRMSGDEFVVLLDGLQSAGDAARVAEKIRAALSEAVALDAGAIHVSSSIGLAYHPDHADDADALIHCADGAMYRAKQQGGNRVHSASEGTEREGATHGSHGRRGADDGSAQSTVH